MKKLLLLTLTLSSLYSPLTGLAQDKWDLRRCVDYAVANNISVKQADVQARLAKLTLEQSQWNQIPTLGLGSQFGVKSGNTQNPNNFTLSTQTYALNNYQLQTSVTAFNFLSLRRAVEASRLSWQAALANTDRTKNDISLNVANAYLQVVLSMEQTEASQLQLHLSQNQLDITRKQVKAGSLPELNAAELEAQVAQDSATYINSKGNIQLNILQLKAYMDLDASFPFDVYAPPVEDIPIEQIADLQPEAVYSLALANQPLQKYDALNIASARKTVASNKGAMYPTLSVIGQLGAGWISNFPEPDFNKTPLLSVDTLYALHQVGSNAVFTQTNVAVATKQKPFFPQLRQTFNQFVGINLNIPILQNGTLHINYARSKLNLRNLELQRDQDNLTLKQNIYQAYTAAITALQKFEANKISVTATQKSFEYSQKRYNVGMLNTIDLLTNQNNFFNARINLLSSQFDYVFKMKVLEYYKGLGIKLTKQ
ncbi:TolC family protein [Puia sp.]|uniref:TolC family protein n=1 Tax=Puia sp. TaxID=2045100 RepID=UPI002F4150BC